MRSMSPIGKISLSTGLLALGFLTMVGTYYIQLFLSSSWKPCSTNSSQLPCTTLRSPRHRDIYSLPKRMAIESLPLLSIPTILSQPVVLSTAVKRFTCFVSIFHLFIEIVSSLTDICRILLLPSQSSLPFLAIKNVV